MAPAKRKRSDVSKKTAPAQKTPTAIPRVTRSRAAAAAAADPAPAETTPGKKTRALAKTPTKATPEAVVAKTPESAEKKARASAKTPTTATPPKTGKSPAAKKKTPAAESLSQKSSGSADVTPSGKGKKGKTTRSKAVAAEEGDDDGQTVIIIEACKQCQSFKRTAERVKKGLEEGLGGVIVNINPEKPRKGCFEVRNENGEVFVSLLNMPRPFKKMKDLDLDKLVAGIVGKKK